MNLIPDYHYHLKTFSLKIYVYVSVHHEGTVSRGIEIDCQNNTEDDMPNLLSQLPKLCIFLLSVIYYVGYLCKNVIVCETRMNLGRLYFYGLSLVDKEYVSPIK